jgi:hypothetical protein
VEFKIFAAAQVLVALVATSAVFLVFFRDRQPLKVLGLTIALVVPLLLYLRLAAGDEAGRLVTGELARAPLIPMSFTAMGLGNTHLVRGLTRFSNGEATSVHAALRFFLVGVPVFLLGSLGLRLLAVPAVLKDVFTPSSHSAHRFFIASFVVCGIIVGLFTKMTCEHAEPYNNSVWFYSLSKYVAWVFVVEVLWAVLRGKRAVVQAFILCVVAGLSVPSTVQFLYLQMSCKSVALGRNVVGAMTFLRERCAPGDVAFTREGLTEPVLAMTKCRVPVSRIAIAPTSEAEAARREEDVHDFWLPMCSERRRGEILRRYKADYLILDRRADQRKPPASGVDTGPLFENDDLAVYRALQ